MFVKKLVICRNGSTPWQIREISRMIRNVSKLRFSCIQNCIKLFKNKFYHLRIHDNFISSFFRQATDLEKESRTRIHRWISTFDKLSSETVDKDGDKFITIVAMKGLLLAFCNSHTQDQTEVELILFFCFFPGGDRGKRRPANRAKYTHCVLYKEGVETSEAIGFIAKKLKYYNTLINVSSVNYCCLLIICALFQYEPRIHLLRRNKR